MTRDLNDPHRLSVLRDLAILDTPPEPAYDEIARLASTCCRSPIAAVNFVDHDRHWTKAIVGVDGGQGANVPADLSFCAATVATDGGALTLEDISKSKAWSAHPFVTGPPFIGFYAGASIFAAGEPIGVVCVFGDEPREVDRQEQEALVALANQVSAHLDLRKRNADLQDLAVTDPLTGLANRTLFFDHLEMARAQHDREGVHVGVVFCDVDDFKLVNDRWGHELGDRLLCQIAHRLQEASRSGDTVARLSGDEFVLVCPNLDRPEELDTIVQRIDRIVNTPYPQANEDAALSARLSIGAAILRQEESAASLLGRADAAMYVTKSSKPSAISAERGAPFAA